MKKFRYENEKHKNNSKKIKFITKSVHARLKETHNISNKMLGECPDFIKFSWDQIIKCYHLPYEPDPPYRDYAMVDIDREFDLLLAFLEEEPGKFIFCGYCFYGDMEEDDTGNLTSDAIRKIPLDDLDESWDGLIKYLKNQQRAHRWSIFMRGFV